MTTGATPFRTQSPLGPEWPSAAATVATAGTAIALALAPVATGRRGRRPAAGTATRRPITSGARTAGLPRRLGSPARRARSAA